MKTTVWPESLPGQAGAARTQVSRRTARICIQKERDARNLSQALPSWASGTSASNRKSVAVACVFVLCWVLFVVVVFHFAVFAFESLMYFCDVAPEYHVIAAGSLLGVALHEGISYPVGKVDLLDLYPFNFREFLCAMDEEGLESALETKDYNLIDNFSDKYLFWLKNYYYTGGMPAVVDAFRLNKDYAEVRQIQSDIVRQYEGDFGKHIIPYCHEKKQRLFAYEYNGYWKDVGTLGSYWEANMELIDIIPEFNLYEEYWKIYTNSGILPPHYISDQSAVEKSIIGNGCDIYGEVHSSVISSGVTIGKGSVVRDSIIMKDAVIGDHCVIDKAIIAENVQIGDNVTLGTGSDTPNKMRPDIYGFGLVTIGEDSVIPSDVQIGKNTAISGVTSKEDYINGELASGETLIKVGE